MKKSFSMKNKLLLFIYFMKYFMKLGIPLQYLYNYMQLQVCMTAWPFAVRSATSKAIFRHVSTQKSQLTEISKDTIAGSLTRRTSAIFIRTPQDESS